MAKVTKTKLMVNGLEFNLRVAGEKRARELIVFLHGFPESSLMWEKTMTAFADQGYCTIAPDQRGYSEGARPSGVENYSMGILADDIIRIAKKFGYDKFHLVGHDIGSVVGWSIAAKYPEKVISWTSLSVPNWPAYLGALQNDPMQKEQGAYVKRFQVPGESEKLIQSNDYAVLKKLWAGFEATTIDKYLELFSKPGALTGVINWYRALFQVESDIDYRSILPDTVLIWGNEDLAISRSGVEQNKQYMSGNYKLVELNATHWLTEFNNGDVNRLIYDNVTGKTFR